MQPISILFRVSGAKFSATSILLVMNEKPSIDLKHDHVIFFAVSKKNEKENGGSVVNESDVMVR